METMMQVKLNYGWDINECLLKVFFEEEEKIVNLKLQDQFNRMGTFFEQCTPEEQKENMLAKEVMEMLQGDFEMRDFLDMYA
jgi:hypothetical protein